MFLQNHLKSASLTSSLSSSIGTAVEGTRVFQNNASHKWKMLCITDSTTNHAALSKVGQRLANFSL